MKKAQHITTYILLLLIGVTSCNKYDEPARIDDEPARIDIPREPQHNEIKIIFNATSENSEALLFISGNCQIDWGNGERSTTSDANKIQEIRHKYEKNKEYTITIVVDGKLRALRNFSTKGLYDFKEEEICLYEDINIGSGVEIKSLYIQTSGVKRFNVKNKLSIEQTYLLLGSEDWNLSMIKSKFLYIYIVDNSDLEVKNIETQHMTISVKNKMNNLSITSCENLVSVDIWTEVFKRVTINNLSITNLPLLNDLRLYSLTGKNAILTDLPQLERTLLNMIDYETLDLTNNIKSSAKMSLKAKGLEVSKSIKLSKQLATMDINNRHFESSSSISKIDFSSCSELESVKLNSIEALKNLKFGIGNIKLNEVTLKNVTSLNSLDFRECKNIKSIVAMNATSLSNAKFSSNNKFLQYVRFEDTNFTESSCIDMISSLPKLHIPNISTVNRRLMSIEGNNADFKYNSTIIDAKKELSRFWSINIH